MWSGIWFEYITLHRCPFQKCPKGANETKWKDKGPMAVVVIWACVCFRGCRLYTFPWCFNSRMADIWLFPAARRWCRTGRKHSRGLLWREGAVPQQLDCADSNSKTSTKRHTLKLSNLAKWTLKAGQFNLKRECRTSWCDGPCGVLSCVLPTLAAMRSRADSWMI